MHDRGMSPFQRNMLLVLAVLVAALGAWQLGQVFALRFEEGDAYAPYSSLRSDPVGCRAFFEAVAAHPGVTAIRNTSDLYRIELTPDTTLMLAGVADSSDPVPLLKRIEGFVEEGSRLTITYTAWAATKGRLKKLAEDAGDNDDETAQKKKPAPELRGGEAGGDDEDDAEEAAGENTEPIGPAAENSEALGPDTCDGFGPEMENIKVRWGFSLKAEALPGENDQKLGKTQVTLHEGVSGLPASIPWRSPIVFTGLDPAWRVIYERDKDPVAIERDFGKGSIVICSDSYLLSNEAVRNDRQSAYLAWLTGGKPRIVFDETHLGIERQMGIAGLIKAFGFQWAILGLMAAAALYIWRNAATFVPRHPEDRVREQAGARVAGEADGLTALLRRGLPARGLLEECWRVWAKDEMASGMADTAKVRAAESIVRDGAEHVAQRFNAIAAALKEK